MTRRFDPANYAIAAWTKSVRVESLFLSVVTIFELEKGILSIDRHNKARGVVLRKWLSEVVVVGFAGRIFPVDLDIATCCAALHVPVTRPENDA